MQIEPRALRDSAFQHMGQQIVGAYVFEHATWRLTDRGAGRGNDVGILDLFAHVSSLISISQGFAVFEHVLDASLCLLGRDQFHEVLTFEVEEPLFIHQAAAFDIAAAHHGRDFARD